MDVKTVTEKFTLGLYFDEGAECDVAGAVLMEWMRQTVEDSSDLIRWPTHPIIADSLAHMNTRLGEAMLIDMAIDIRKFCSLRKWDAAIDLMQEALDMS